MSSWIPKPPLELETGLKLHIHQGTSVSAVLLLPALENAAAGLHPRGDHKASWGAKASSERLHCPSWALGELAGTWTSTQGPLI